eukprot:UN01592
MQIISLLVLTKLALANRILLQHTPVTIPTDVPYQPIVIPEPITPQSILPGGPIGVLPPPAEPNVYIPVEIPSLHQPHTELVCDIPYSEPGSCALLSHAITNPVEKFKLQCSNFGSCAGANITLDYTPGTFAERIHYLLFTEMSTAYKAIITIRNRMPNRALLIENLECIGPMSCEETTFVFEGLISVADFKCVNEEYCRGCQVKRDINDFVGIPC